MSKYKLTKKAVEDLTAIWHYTADTWSEKQADKYFDLLLSMCQDISENPQVGRVYNNISQELKGVRAGRHIVFYEVSNEWTILIIRILHERMDLDKRILDI